MTAAVMSVLAEHGLPDVDESTAAYLAAAARGHEPVDATARLLDRYGFVVEGHGRALAHQIVQAVRRGDT